MINIKRQQAYLVLAITICCLIYIVLEFFYHRHTMLAVDEFWFAHRIYQFKDGIPYRDFAPYKTVIGYYLLLPAMLLPSKNILQTLFTIKDMIALINAVVLFISALWLTRFFSRISVLLSLILIISAEIVLSYSTQIRVDLLGYWFCFFSLLCLLEKRFVWAGLLIGLGFSTTQKSIWYIFASNIALGLQWLLYNRSLKDLKPIIIFNCTYALFIAAYIICWSLASDLHTVIASLFYEASAMYQLDWYDSARISFWHTIIRYNPTLFLLWPATLFSLCATTDQDTSLKARAFIVTYAFTILLCLIPYKQVFPYYMQVTFPVLFAVYAGVIAWIFTLFSANSTRLFVTKPVLWLMLTIYIALLAIIVFQLTLPIPYLLIGIIPFCIVMQLTMKKPQPWSKTLLHIIGITMVFTGLVYPNILVPAKIAMLNNAYQKSTLESMTRLLADGSDYVAGIELFYNKTQPIPGIRHLMGPAIDYLRNPTPKLRTVMLASLYEDPNATQQSVVQALQQSSVKFYVNNYRMNALPHKIKKYLAANYQQWSGSIYLYAPHISNGRHKIDIKFNGKYFVERKSPVTLDGKQVAGDFIYLQKGEHVSSAASDYRLKLIPDNITPSTDPAFTKDDWRKVIF